MEPTQEQRQELLEGDERRAERKLSPLGFGDATTAPDWARERIIEIRSAIVEKRAVPAPTRSWTAGAEKRSLARTAQGTRALNFVNRLLPTRTRSLEDIFLQQYGIEYRVFRAQQETETLKRRLHAQGQIIFGEKRRAREADAARERAADAARDKEKREREIRETVRSIFPWEFN